MNKNSAKRFSSGKKDVVNEEFEKPNGKLQLQYGLQKS